MVFFDIALNKLALLCSGAVCALLVGCGTTKSYTATEQLLMSDAVDATVAQLDFSALSNKKVYLDSTYFTTTKGPQLIDSDYVLSSLRQQMTSYGVLLSENRADAELIAEARLGALGYDGHSVSYGMPASGTLSTAASAVTGTPLLPSLPEISLARKELKQGAAKVAVFVYDRQTLEPYWQSGIAKSSSSAKDTWVMGIGPFQQGTIYEGPQFAGGRFTDRFDSQKRPSDTSDRPNGQLAKYRSERLFAKSKKDAASPKSVPPVEAPTVITASAEGPPTSSNHNSSSLTH